MSIAMVQSIIDRIALHTEQLNSLDIREFYKKQQELLHHITKNNLDPSQLQDLTSITPSKVATSSRHSSPPDSPISRISTMTSTTTRSNLESKLLFDNTSNNQAEFSQSQYSDYSSVLPKGLASSKKSSRGSTKISHSHRLQTTFTINEHGERVYEMTALPPDPRALLDDTNGFVKSNSTDDEKIVFR